MGDTVPPSEAVGGTLSAGLSKLELGEPALTEDANPDPDTAPPPSWDNLPEQLWFAVAEMLQPPSWRGVLRHVSRAGRGAVGQLEAAAAEADEAAQRAAEAPPRWEDPELPAGMRAEELSSTAELMAWSDRQGCPWHPNNFMEAAAGEPHAPAYPVPGTPGIPMSVQYKYSHGYLYWCCFVSVIIKSKIRKVRFAQGLRPKPPQQFTSCAKCSLKSSITIS